MQKSRFSALREQLKSSFFLPFAQSPTKRQQVDPFVSDFEAQSENQLVMVDHDPDSSLLIKSSTEQCISTSSDVMQFTPQKKPKIVTTCLEFEQIYNEGEPIGQGGHAVVKRCIKKYSRDQCEYAVKIFRSGDPEIINTIRKTFNINVILKHDNICQAMELYIDERREQCYYVQEYCPWPSLEEVLASKKQLSHQEAKILMTELFRTVYYLHVMGVAHRDIKPDNILVNFTNNQCKIKLIDFGVSKQFYIHKTRTIADMWTRTGNIFYQPPESFLGGGYNEKIDIWSLGVVLYQIMTGRLPFECDTIMETIELIQKAQLETQFIKPVPRLIVDLMKRILHQDPTQRLSAKESLMHPWIQSEFKDNDKQFLKHMSKDDACERFGLLQLPTPNQLIKQSSDGIYLTPDLRKAKTGTFAPQSQFLCDSLDPSKFKQQLSLGTQIHHIKKEKPQKNRFRTFSLNNITIKTRQFSPIILQQSQWLANSVIMESPLKTVQELL